MKKIMFALVAIAVAGVAQAAAVNWKTTAVKIMNTTGTDVVAAGSSSAYTAMVTFWDAGGNQIDLGAQAANAKDTTASMSQYGGTVSDVFANNKQYYAQLTLSSADYTITSEKALFTIGDQDATINFTNGTGFDSEAAKITYTASNWQSTAAPEPTSGVLLLLGMAGLALKRKRA